MYPVPLRLLTSLFALNASHFAISSALILKNKCLEILFISIIITEDNDSLQFYCKWRRIPVLCLFLEF